MTAAITALSNRVILSWGAKRAVIAVAAGALSALSMPPVDAFPVLAITLPVLVWLIDGAAGGRYGAVVAAFRAGWLFGFGYFLAGLYWVGIAFLVEAKTFGWLMPFAVILLPAGLALFIGAGTALARLFWVRGPLRIVAFAVCLFAVEWLRGQVLGGFPWNSFGYALSGSLALAQTASLVGLWGLTLIALLVFSTPALLADEPDISPRRWTIIGLAALVPVAMAVFGLWRLSGPPVEMTAGIKLRIVQPDIPQDEKFRRAAKDRVMAQYLTLSDRSTGPATTGIKDVTHLIWPESAFPFYVQREPDVLAQIAALLPPGTILFTGAVRGEGPKPDGTFARAFNSVYAIGDDGTLLAVHDKVTLVPFGEFLPFQPVLEAIGLQQLTRLRGGFTPGDRLRLMSVPKTPPLAALVCYEAIFPGHVTPRGQRPDWLLNVTNDAWFGHSSGPYQHLRQAQLRTIEEGLPMVRAANNGVSAVIDPYGRILRSLPLGGEGVLDSGLPRSAPETTYAKSGDLPALATAIFALFFLTLRRFAGKP
jgi:apolipoprotein N-acyltransferase